MALFIDKVGLSQSSANWAKFDEDTRLWELFTV